MVMVGKTSPFLGVVSVCEMSRRSYLYIFERHLVGYVGGNFVLHEIPRSFFFFFFEIKLALVGL